MYIKITPNRFLKICLVIAVLLTACIPTKINGEVQNTDPTLAPTPAPSPAILAKTLVADPEYLRDCMIVGSPRQHIQLDYLDIFPGQSTDENVKTLLGDPLERNHVKKIEEWVYSGFNIYLESNIVTSIDVYDDVQIMVSLKELISEYGCPDLIFAIDTSIDQPAGNYDLTKFIYYNNGVEFFFPDFPVSLSDVPISIGFFKAESLESYLERYNYDNYGPENGKLVSWNEAVQ